MNGTTLKTLLYAITNLEHYARTNNGMALSKYIETYNAIVIEGLITSKFVKCEVVNYELIERQRYIKVMLVYGNVRVAVKQKLNEGKWKFYQKNMKLYGSFNDINYGAETNDGVMVLLDNVYKDFNLVKSYAIAFSLIVASKSYNERNFAKYYKQLLSYYDGFGLKPNYIAMYFKRLCVAEKDGVAIKCNWYDAIKNKYEIKLK